MMNWMKFKFAISATLVALLAGGAITAAISQENSGGGGPTALKIAQQSQAAYAALSSYSDTGTATSTGAGASTKTTFDIRLQRPNFYRVEWSQGGGFYSSHGTVRSDGTGNYLSYTGANAPIKPQKMHNMEIAIGSATGISDSAAADIPGTFFNLGWGDQLGVIASGRSNVERGNDEKIGETDCYVLSYSIGPVKLPNNMGSSGTATTRLWIGKQDHLIRQVETTSKGGTTHLKISDDDLKTILERAGKPTTAEAIADLRQKIEQDQKAAQTGTFVSIQTHENISVNQKFSVTDFAD